MRRVAERLVAAWCALAAATPAFGANRTVCFEFVIDDDRDDCPSGKTGLRRDCNPTGQASVSGFRYELWDKDPGGADELIGTFHLGDTGRRCATFPWEGEAYQLGEAHPDVYLRVLPEVRGSATGIKVVALDGDGDPYAATNFRGPDGVDTFVAAECTTGANCQILPGDAMVLASDPMTSKGLAVQALDSAQRTLQVYDGHINNSNYVDMWVDFTSNLTGVCEGTGRGMAPSRFKICISDEGARNGHTPPHELGHVLQQREFGNDYLRLNYNKNGNDSPTWTPTTEEYDSAATAEGWAEYVASVSFWDPSNFGSEPEQDSVLIELASLLSGFSCTSTAGGSVYQVARAFWDLDDANPEPGVGPMVGFPDGQNLGTTWILNQWSEFPPGVHDHADYECCENGVNVRDFLHHASPTAEINTLIRHNCLDGQQ